MGRKLEQRLRMVYLRSARVRPLASVEDPSLLGMEALVEDVERVPGGSQGGEDRHYRRSFGGMIALEYAKRHPDRVRSMVLVETTADLPAALQQCSC